MSKGKSVILEKVAGRANEFIIKDVVGITCGRVFMIEIARDNRNCILRLKFYRKDSYEMLRDALMILLKSLFASRDINKVNILVDELVDIKAFSDLGCSLEGVLEDNVMIGESHINELLFGITSMEFESVQRTNIFRLQGIHLELKVLTPENSQEMLDYNIRNKDHLRSFEPTREESFYTLDTQRKILIEEYKQYLNGNSISCGIFKDDKLIGKIRISNIVYGIFKSAVLGYSIDEEEQGKGYMKEAVNLIVDYAFDDMELHRIEASALLDNNRSLGVLRACGFKELGINKDYLYINGIWRDHMTFYKINTN